MLHDLVRNYGKDKTNECFDSTGFVVVDTGVITVKIDEQKTDATRNRIVELVKKL